LHHSCISLQSLLTLLLAFDFFPISNNMDLPVLPGITVQTVTSSRITTRVLFSGPPNGTPVLFMHGYSCSASFWEESMLALPEGFRGIAYDHRGHGAADPQKIVDATRGEGDLGDDAFALLDALNIPKAHIIGHSMGGLVVWQLIRTQPSRILSATAVCPVSPFGLSGTDSQGDLLNPDGAGSGAGILSKDLVRMLDEGVRENTGPTSPLGFIRGLFVKPPFRFPREEVILNSMFAAHRSDRALPGDSTTSTHWPFLAPGRFGCLNAMSPLYNRQAWLVSKEVGAKLPPVMWVWATGDVVIAECTSALDTGRLGELGVIPGWPGAKAYPAQNMISQTRMVLEHYKENGGKYEEVVMDTGHSPSAEQPEEFNKHFHSFFAKSSQ
jgi:pimeloyl-ACP methyl ester carboxylesterase